MNGFRTPYKGETLYLQLPEGVSHAQSFAKVTSDLPIPKDGIVVYEITLQRRLVARPVTLHLGFVEEYIQ